MGARKAKRRKLARKVIRHILTEYTSTVAFCHPMADDLSDREFDALVREIRKARVTVKWDA